VAIEFMCRKIGMTQVFNDDGEAIPVTVLDAQPNRVIQKKTPERDGYSALQLGFGVRAQRHATKPLQGHCAKAGAPPAKVLRESRIPAADLEKYEVGQEINVDIFAPGQRVDVIGTSKGRGFAGVVKRHGFGVRTTHGAHEYFRHGGSIGPGSFPGRVIKGLRMPGHMGDERVTTLNIEVVRVDPEKRLLFVRGGVPGHNDALVRVRSSVKARAAK
jgi:large subunit ribosomal protein L3